MYGLEVLWWTLTIVLMLAGLLGAVFPVLPDSLLILAGACLHFFTMPAQRTIGWGTLAVLVLLTLLAHVVDFAAGALGARKFGASRWGAFGGIAGAVVGLFFFPLGLFLGPVIGALCAEVVFARRSFGPAVRSSWGTLLGTTAGMIGKIVIDVAMVAIFFFVALFWNRA